MGKFNELLMGKGQLRPRPGGGEKREKSHHILCRGGRGRNGADVSTQREGKGKSPAQAISLKSQRSQGKCVIWEESGS